MKRRTFLHSIAQAGILATGLPPIGKLFAATSQRANPPAMNVLPIPPTIAGGSINIAKGTAPIFSGITTDALLINNSFPAPTIIMKKGSTFTAAITNNLTEPAVIHWHGIHAPSAMDGHPKNAIPSGGMFDVSFPVVQRACTSFYHSHADMNTAKQSYMGMMGMIIVDDGSSVGLFGGDIPLLIQDKRFDSNKQLVYEPTVADMASGWLGDTILINGAPNVYLDVSTTAYRFRLVNGSNARMYNIALSDGSPFSVIANDGGLLEHPVSLTSAMLAPAERLEIVIDFNPYAIGSSLTLISAAFSYSGNPGTSTLAQGAEIDLLKFNVTQVLPKGQPLPTTISTITPYDPANIQNSRLFELTGHQYINSQSFDINRIDQHVPFGNLEKWTFSNLSEDSHPMHVHGTQFQVMNRGSGNPPLPTEAGWKDVVLVGPNETVNVLVLFVEYRGLYLVHCHNLEHEDMGMMSNFMIEDPGSVTGETTIAEAIRVTPNPASDHAILKFDTLQSEQELILYDLQGKIVIKQMLTPGSDMIGIPTSELANGKYIIRIGVMQASVVVVH